MKVKIKTSNDETFYIPNKTFQDVFLEIDSIKKSKSDSFYVYEKKEGNHFALDVNAIVSISAFEEPQPNIRAFFEDED